MGVVDSILFSSLIIFLCVIASHVWWLREQQTNPLARVISGATSYAAVVLGVLVGLAALLKEQVA